MQTEQVKDKYYARDEQDFQLFYNFINSKSNRYHIEKMPDGDGIDAKMSAMTEDNKEVIRTYDIEIKVRDGYTVFDDILIEGYKWEKLMDEDNDHKWFFFYFPKSKQVEIIDFKGWSRQDLEEYRDDSRYALPNKTLDDNGKRYYKKYIYYVPTKLFTGYTYDAR